MYAKGTTLETLQAVANELDMELNETDSDNGRNRIKFTIRLKPGNLRFAKMSPNPDGDISFSTMTVEQWKWRRAGRSVCFHGHYAFFHRLFELSPNASVESSWYGKIVHTKETLRENAQKMGQTPLGNPGNIYHVFQVRETCKCLEDDPNPLEIY